MTKAVRELKIGDRFSWIPAAWYGPCLLLGKSDGDESDTYDLSYAARVVNPPGISYGVPGQLRVRMLKPTKDLKREGRI